MQFVLGCEQGGAVMITTTLLIVNALVFLMKNPWLITVFSTSMHCMGLKLMTLFCLKISIATNPKSGPTLRCSTSPFNEFFWVSQTFCYAYGLLGRKLGYVLLLYRVATQKALRNILVCQRQGYFKCNLLLGFKSWPLLKRKYAGFTDVGCTDGFSPTILPFEQRLRF